MKFLGNYFQMGDSPTPDCVLGDFIYAEQTAQGQTTSTAAPGTTYLSAAKVLPPGEYLVVVTTGWAHANNGKNGFLLLRHNNTTLKTSVDRNTAAGSQYSFPVTLRAKVVITVPDQTQTFDLNYYSSAGTMYLNGAEITVERIA